MDAEILKQAVLGAYLENGKLGQRLRVHLCLGSWNGEGRLESSPIFHLSQLGTALGQGPCVLSSLLFRAWHMVAGTK